MASEKIKNDGKTIQEEFRNLEILNRFHSAIQKNLDLQAVLETIVEQIQTIFHVPAIEIHLLEKESGILFLKAHRGFPPHLIGTGTLQSDEGLPGNIVKKRHPVFISDLGSEPNINRELLVEEKFTHYGGIPLIHLGEIIGVVGLYAHSGQAFSEENQNLLIKLGQIISISVQNGKLYEQASARAKRLVAISRAIAVTKQLGSLNDMLLDFAKVLVQSLGFEQSWIGILEKNGTSLHGKTGFGVGMNKENIETEYSIDMHSKNPAVISVVQKKAVVFNLIEDVEDRPMQQWLNGLNIQSFTFIPIAIGEEIFGVVGVFYMSSKSIEEEDIKTLTSLAEQTATAIENTRLYDEVKHSEQRYRTLFKATGTSIVILDDDLQFRLVNQAFEQLSGYTQDELIGKMDFIQFFEAHKLKREDILKKLQTSPQNWETHFFDKKGSQKQVHMITAQIPESSDILVSLIDITRQRELERQLYRSEELAAVGELSAGIAHEIRNPLVAITNSVSLLMDETSISEEGKQLLEIVKEETHHLAAIVDDFLQFAKPKKPTYQEEDINQLIRDVIKRYKDCQEKNIQWVEELDESVPNIHVDRHQIQQVLTNLMLNSIDAMEDNGILTIKTEKPVDNRIKITITDSGAGIAQEELSKIFQPFYSTKEKGTGMGLAICRRIINNHYGDILVDSELGMGSTFTILIPLDLKSQ